MPNAELAPLFPVLRELGLPVVDATPMTGDVSQRRYFRLTLGDARGTAILALYPPALRTAARRYRLATALLAGAEVRVPALLAEHPEGAWIVTEDLGPATVFDLRTRAFGELEGYFAAAVAAVERIESLDRGLVMGLNPPLDEALLRRELAMTRRAFFEPRGLSLPADAEAALAALCSRLGTTPRVPCHRDLNVRNLLPLGAAGVGIVDHQDLRLGPRGYDVASLLNDSLFPPADAEERLLGLAGLARQEYHRAAAQRTLKAVGTYAAFADRSPRYLPLIAPTLRRALEHLERTPETANVAPRLRESWREVVAAKPES